VIISLATARATPTASDRDAIKRLATRATAGEGDLVVWAAAAGSDSNQVRLAVGRALTIKRLAVKLARLRPGRIGIQVGPGETAARNRILVALLAPESGAAAVTPPPAGGKGKAGKGAVSPPAEPPPGAPASIEPPAPPALAPDAGAKEERDAGPAAPDGAPDTLAAAPDTQPARVERLVPLPPALKEGAAAEDQLGNAVASFQPALTECVNRALKRDPSLRGEALIALDIRPNGRARLARIKSKTLTGGWFEECVRRAAVEWRMPRTPQGYQVEIPVKIHIANGGSP
jgi:hypothetical protein